MIYKAPFSEKMVWYSFILATYFRRRSLVAIRTRDLNSLQDPTLFLMLTLSYSWNVLWAIHTMIFVLFQALPTNRYKFCTLASKSMSLWTHQLIPLIQNSAMSLLGYVFITFAELCCHCHPLSFINGAHSAITLQTKNVFIECTATDLTKAKDCFWIQWY